MLQTILALTVYGGLFAAFYVWTLNVVYSPIIATLTQTAGR